MRLRPNLCRPGRSIALWLPMSSMISAESLLTVVAQAPLRGQRAGDVTVLQEALAEVQGA
jgi:hypothetical protein